MLRDRQLRRRPAHPADQRAARRVPDRDRAARAAQAGRRPAGSSCAATSPRGSPRASPRTGSSVTGRRHRCRSCGPIRTSSRRSSATSSRTRCGTATGTVTVTVGADGDEATARGHRPGRRHHAARRCRGSSPSSGTTPAAAAPGSGCSSRRASSRPTAGRSRPARRPTAGGAVVRFTLPAGTPSFAELSDRRAASDASSPPRLCRCDGRSKESRVRTQRLVRPQGSGRAVRRRARRRRIRRRATPSRAAADLDALAAAHAAHLGSRSPVALARRELGALPPQARADAGRRVNEALDRDHVGVRRPLAPSSRPRATSGCSSRRPSTSRCRGTPSPPGGRHPLTLIQERVADVFVAMGWEVAEGPEVEAEWLNFDALNIPPCAPGAGDARTRCGSTRPSGGVRAAHAHLAGPAPRAARARRALLRRRARPGLPPGGARRHPHAGLPPARRARGRRGPDDGGPARHARDARRGDVRLRVRDPAAPRPLPVHRAVGRRRPAVLGLPRRVDRSPAASPAGPAGPRAGSSGAAAGWCTRSSSPRPGSTPTATPASRSAWASSAP